MNITEFLLARISEDESRYPRPTGARQSGKTFWLRQQAECAAKREIIAMYIRLEARALAYRSPLWADTMNDLDRLDWRKAEARYATMDSVVRALARVYADHPDFDPTCM